MKLKKQAGPHYWLKQGVVLELKYQKFLKEHGLTKEK